VGAALIAALPAAFGRLATALSPRVSRAALRLLTLLLPRLGAAHPALPAPPRALARHLLRAAAWWSDAPLWDASGAAAEACEGAPPPCIIPGALWPPRVVVGAGAAAAHRRLAAEAVTLLRTLARADGCGATREGEGGGGGGGGGGGWAAAVRDAVAEAVAAGAPAPAHPHPLTAAHLFALGALRVCGVSSGTEALRQGGRALLRAPGAPPLGAPDADPDAHAMLPFSQPAGAPLRSRGVVTLSVAGAAGGGAGGGALVEVQWTLPPGGGLAAPLGPFSDPCGVYDAAAGTALVEEGGVCVSWEGGGACGAGAPAWPPPPPLPWTHPPPPDAQVVPAALLLPMDDVPPPCDVFPFWTLPPARTPRPAAPSPPPRGEDLHLRAAAAVEELALGAFDAGELGWGLAPRARAPAVPPPTTPAAAAAAARAALKAASIGALEAALAHPPSAAALAARADFLPALLPTALTPLPGPTLLSLAALRGRVGALSDAAGDAAGPRARWCGARALLIPHFSAGGAGTGAVAAAWACAGADGGAPSRARAEALRQLRRAGLAHLAAELPEGLDARGAMAWATAGAVRTRAHERTPPPARALKRCSPPAARHTNNTHTHTRQHRRTRHPLRR
jgi:hypothetical protein